MGFLASPFPRNRFSIPGLEDIPVLRVLISRSLIRRAGGQRCSDRPGAAPVRIAWLVPTLSACTGASAVPTGAAL